MPAERSGSPWASAVKELDRVSWPYQAYREPAAPLPHCAGDTAAAVRQAGTTSNGARPPLALSPVVSGKYAFGLIFSNRPPGRLELLHVGWHVLNPGWDCLNFFSADGPSGAGARAREIQRLLRPFLSMGSRKTFSAMPIPIALAVRHGCTLASCREVGIAQRRPAWLLTGFNGSCATGTQRKLAHPALEFEFWKYYCLILATLSQWP